MTRVLEWLLDLDSISVVPPKAGGSLHFQWQAPWPGWLIAGLAALVPLFVFMTYRAEEGKRPLKVVLGAIRVALIAAVVAVLCKPALVLQRNRVEPSYVAMLVDDSSSMGRSDHYIDPAESAAAARAAGLNPAQVGHAVPSVPVVPEDGATPSDADEPLRTVSRWDIARRAALADGAKGLRAVLRNNELDVYTFSGRAELQRKIVGESAVDEAVRWWTDHRPAGSTTDVAAALADAMSDIRGRRLSAIVIVSDGRCTEPADLADAIHAAESRQIPVHTVLMGSSSPPRDVAVGPLRAESQVYVRDLAAIQASIAAGGLDRPQRLKVRLLDDDRNRELDAAEIELGGDKPTGDVEFRIRPSRGGNVRFRVQVEPVADEVETQNNSDAIMIKVIDDKLRLLYVEGYPRFEYRFIKNAYLREETVICSMLLLSADEEFPQEGNEPIRRFPDTPEELNRYDVVLFGDVDPTGEWLTSAQQKMLVDFVANRGGGFGVIAGERNAPRKFMGTALEKLLPVRIDSQFLGKYDAPLTDGYRPRLTLEGRSSRLFRFVSDPRGNENVLDALPGWYWLARTLGPRPGAEVLLEHPTIQAESGRMPLLVVGRYGAGKVLFIAGDETWRWREGQGEPYFDTFWLQVARYLTQTKQIGRDRRYNLTTDRPRYSQGRPVTVRATINDDLLLAGLSEQVRVVIHDAAGDPVKRMDLIRLGRSSNIFEANFVPDAPGAFDVQADLLPGSADEKPITARFSVESVGPEQKIAQADHETLRRLARQTGGDAVYPDQLAELLGRIPSDRVEIPDDVIEPIWDTRLVLILFLVLICAEWIVRKAGGMI